VAALWLLARLQIRGFLRSRSRFSIGITVALVALLFWARAVDPARVLARSDVDLQAGVRAFMILALLALTIATATIGRGRNVAFTPAEIDTLFPGPFSGRRLVLYKVVFIAIGATWPALLVAIVYRRVAGAGLAGPLGMWLAFVMAHLIAMLAQGVSQILHRRPHSPRTLVPALLVTGLVLAASLELLAYVAWGVRSADGFLAHTAASRALWLVLAPFDLVARVYTARTTGALLLWTSASAACAAAMVAVLLGLERALRERAVASRELFARLAQRSLRGDRSSRLVTGLTRVRLGMLPRMGGIGPTAWVRLMAALRAPGRVAAVTALTLLAAFLVSLAGPSSSGAAAFAVGALWIVVMPATIPFDFRLEAGNLAVWKVLPIGRLALGLGQLATPWTLLMLLAWGALGAGAAAAPTIPPALVWAFFFVPPAALLAVGIENALFLAFPGANVPSGDVDPVAAVQGWLFVLGRVALWTLVGVAAGTAAAVVGPMFVSETAGVAAAWLVVTSAAIVSVAAVAWLAGRFDPSNALPPT
jgi:hypothetical protein